MPIERNDALAKEKFAGRQTIGLPVHPGEHLLEDFMKPLGISANRLATDIRVPATRIGAIIHGKRSITADTALRLARYFDTTPQFWMNLQARYDLETAEAELGDRLEREVVALSAG